MSRRECTHKVANDFIVARVEGRTLWECSGCGLVGAWQPDWMFHGNLECRGCQAQAIDVAYCGRCATSVDQTKPPKRRRTTQQTSTETKEKDQ